MDQQNAKPFTFISAPVCGQFDLCAIRILYYNFFPWSDAPGNRTKSQRQILKILKIRVHRENNLEKNRQRRLNMHHSHGLVSRRSCLSLKVQYRSCLTPVQANYHHHTRHSPWNCLVCDEEASLVLGDSRGNWVHHVNRGHT